jgi:RNA polymerase sigma-70 factor (ECF subfamily)
MSALEAAFRDQHARHGGGPATRLDGLEPRLASCLASARAAWPTVTLDGAAYARVLADKVAEHDDAGGPAAVLHRLHTDDLYLAAACAAGDPAAMSALRAAHFADLAAVVRRTGCDATLAGDVEQQVLETLFLGGDLGPRIATYSGRGDLRSWLRSIAVRTALKAVARARDGADGVLGDDALADIAATADDPQLAELRRVYADHFATALRDALATLSRRQRVLLRLHFLDGLSLDDLARMYSVHRSTAARWLQGAREALFDETRARVIRTLGAGEAESDFLGIVRLVQSQLDVSIADLLR